MKYILTLLFLTISVSAEIVVTAPNMTVVNGQTFDVFIQGDDLDDVIAHQFLLVHDSNIIQPVGSNFGCSTEDTIDFWFIPVCNVYPIGTLRTAVYTSNYPVTGSGPILRVTFQAVGLGTSQLHFTQGHFFNSVGQVPSKYIDGSVTVLGLSSSGGVE